MVAQIHTILISYKDFVVLNLMYENTTAPFHTNAGTKTKIECKSHP
jgi:hypothetical protein